MASSTYSGKITTPKSAPVGAWTTVVPSLDASSGGHVHAMVYLNISGTLSGSNTSGIFDVRAIRTATGDDTALQTFVARGDPGGAFTTFVTHMWLGANPGGFYWQVRPRNGIGSLTANTRYSKFLDA